MGKKLLLAGICALILVAVFLFFSKRGKGTELVVTTGVIEGTEVSLSSKIAGRISEFCCKEGDRVNAGSVLIRLESEEIRASLEQARAGILRARADVDSADASVKSAEANIKGSEAEIRAAESDMERAKVQVEEALREMQRAERLFKDGFISKAEMDLSATSYESIRASFGYSKARLDAATAKKEATLSQLNTSISLLASARARLKEAEASLKLQEARLRDTEIVSPISGVVVFKGMEAGEVVSPGATIVTIVDMEDLWVRADIEETMVGRVRVGDEAVISTDGMPGTAFKGAVAEIGREADFATLKDVTRGRQDIKTFRVKIKIEDKTGTLKPGMTAKVKLVGKG